MAVAEPRPRMSVDAKKCSGCRMCELLCSFVHEREVNPRRARIRVLLNEKEGINAPLLCNQCKKCIDSCKRGALSWDEATGVVRVDVSKCNACGLCIPVCEEGGITVDPVAKKVNICDLCNGDPECIKWCPEGVLGFASTLHSGIGSEARSEARPV